MKYCTRCGKALDDNANFCGECGTRLEGNSPYGVYNTYNQNTNNQPQESSTLSICALIFAFVSPIIGVILGIMGCVKYQTPSYKKMSIAAIILSVASWVISFILLSVVSKYIVDMSMFGI